MKFFPKVLILMFFVVNANLYGQIGIGTTTPNASSVLDIESNNKGLLIPRIPLVDTADNITIANPATSLLVYNTTTNSNITEGYYYWNASQWVRLSDKTPRLFNGTSNPSNSIPANSIPGDVYVNSTTGALFTFDGTNWVSQSIANNILTTSFIATDGQTEFTTPWTVSTSNIKVFRNGINISFSVLSTNVLKIENEAVCYQNDEIKIYKYL